ncbi:hypothetical protein [Phenylobacterium conjunctum]|uniref:Uncharacterized protein n=1 Tax=Phenylobacterium conjunctum TaxID=1298959 RepID=A0ABW3SXV6_9CAUL
MASVYFDPAVGGDGSTVTDDSNASTGLDNGGHRTRFVPALAQIVAIAANVVTKAAAAAASAASALGAPGTNATSTSSLTIGTGAISLTLAQTGKAYSVGQSVVIARTSAPATTAMWGVITAFNSGTGAMTVQVATGQTLGSGTFTDWTISLTASGTGVPGTRQISAAGLATGGGDFTADRTITVTAAALAAVRTGTTKTQVMTPGDTYDALAEVTLTDAATIAVDMSTFVNATVTLGGNRTLGNPTNAKPGQTGRIRVVQDGTGGRTLAFGSNWKREGGAPTASTAAGVEDYIDFDVVSSTKIRYNFAKNPS